MIRRPPRSTRVRSSAASDVYKRQVFMLAIGAIFFNQTIRWQQVIGAVLSIAGVLLVLCRGDWNALANVQLVIGDIYVLIATACWGFYSWLLSRPDDPAEIRSKWAYFLMAQMAFGLSWSGLFTTGEWLAGDAYVHWTCLLYTSPSPRDGLLSRMPSSA